MNDLKKFDFREQFSFIPKIEEGENLSRQCDNFIFAGMGGSRLAGLILNSWKPDIPLRVHSNYCLPNIINPNTLFIANSHSGETEETINALETAVCLSLETAVMSTGGKLFNFAEKKNIPRILLPNTGLPPRLSVGYHLCGLLAMLNKKDILSKNLEIPSRKETSLDNFGEELSGRIPIIYSSENNSGLAYFWKIQLNETAKVPAFYNILPEANHNEIAGLKKEPDLGFLSKFYFILIEDEDDWPEVTKRFSVLSDWLTKEKYPLKKISLKGEDRLDNILDNLNQAVRTSATLAEIRQQEPFTTPAIDDFKKMMKV